VELDRTSEIEERPVDRKNDDKDNGNCGVKRKKAELKPLQLLGTDVH